MPSPRILLVDRPHGFLIEAMQDWGAELASHFDTPREEILRLLPEFDGVVMRSAIIHGNGQDESKNVCIELHRRKDAIAIRISDEGRGFDYNNVPDPTLPENVCKCGGRGVFLMRNCSDQIAFRNNGSTVEMQFKLW